VADAARPWVGLDAGHDADATFVFPVVVEPAGFARYCRDAATLSLEFADGRTGCVAATASVDVSRVDPGRTVRGAKTVRGRDGAAVGSVRVALRVEFRTRVESSFERNERIAAAQGDVDCGVESADSTNTPDVVEPIDTAEAPETEAPFFSAASPESKTTKKNRGKLVSSDAGGPGEPLCALEAAELLRRAMDEALAFDGATAARVIDEEIHAKRLRSKRAASTVSEEDVAGIGSASARVGSRHNPFAAKPDPEPDAEDATTVLDTRWSRETTTSERETALVWLGGTADDPEGLDRDADDASACAEEALVCALSRLDADADASEDAEDAEDRATVYSDPDTERLVASAAASAAADAQLDDRDGSGEDRDVEIRLALHNGSIRALDEAKQVPVSGFPLVVVVKGGHPFPAGELARVELNGLGARGAGAAIVRLPSAVVEALLDANKKTPILALEVWDPTDLLVDRDGNEARFRDERDAVSVSFASLFGDFSRADPRAMKGVVVVPLDFLEPRARRARRRADENRKLGLVPLHAGASTPEDLDAHGFFGDDAALNRVFEMRGVYDGVVHGYLGVEAGLVRKKLRAQRL